jgi:hypothetical protein
MRSPVPARADGAWSPPSSRPLFAQDDAGAAKQQWRKVADQLRPKLPKLATLMDEAEHDVLAYMTFPAPHRSHAGQLTHSHPRKAPNPHHPKHLGKMRMIQLVKTLIAGIARAGIENLALSVHCDKMRAFPHHFSAMCMGAKGARMAAKSRAREGSLQIDSPHEKAALTAFLESLTAEDLGDQFLERPEQ